jgi:hypothetical protein
MVYGELPCCLVGGRLDPVLISFMAVGVSYIL